MRLTIAQKHTIAAKAASHALKEELLRNEDELENLAEAIYESETSDFQEVIQNAPTGFFQLRAEIIVTVDGVEEGLPLADNRRVPNHLLTGELEFGEGIDLYNSLSGAIIERNRLEREVTRMKSDLMNEILLPATSLTGLVKKWPKVVDFLTAEMRAELKHQGRVDEILTLQEEG